MVANPVYLRAPGDDDWVLAWPATEIGSGQDRVSSRRSDHLLAATLRRQWRESAISGQRARGRDPAETDLRALADRPLSIRASLPGQCRQDQCEHDLGGRSRLLRGRRVRLIAPALCQSATSTWRSLPAVGNDR